MWGAPPPKKKKNFGGPKQAKFGAISVELKTLKIGEVPDRPRFHLRSAKKVG